MISSRAFLSLVAVVSVTACAGTNTLTTNSVEQEVDIAAPITSDNAALRRQRMRGQQGPKHPFSFIKGCAAEGQIRV
ncbi:MAG: hypothetical protein Ct9H300mP26_2160 [Acidimicrobiales bacterium]|nr:MAG: hypothetical protein Ct9H300mP26_2160 [Acidimicrobiales bacterium]